MFGCTQQGSWTKKIMDRVYNVEKSRKRKASDSDIGTPARKRGRPKRLVISLESRYPTVSPQFDGEREKEQAALTKEMEKDKPRKNIVVQLMKETFYSRRQYILLNDESVVSKLAKYQGFTLPPVVSKTHTHI